MDWSLVRAGIVIAVLVATPVAASMLQAQVAGPEDDAARAAAAAGLRGLASSLERLAASEGNASVAAYDDARAWASTLVHLRDTWPAGRAPLWAEDAAALGEGVLAWRLTGPDHLDDAERSEVGLLATHVRAASVRLTVGEEARADADLAMAAASAAGILGSKG